MPALQRPALATAGGGGDPRVAQLADSPGPADRIGRTERRGRRVAAAALVGLPLLTWPSRNTRYAPAGRLADRLAQATCGRRAAPPVSAPESRLSEEAAEEAVASWSGRAPLAGRLEFQLYRPQVSRGRQAR